jgi:succinate-semialdehyde dehydrogenase/glutarate-semialdehyde dehydrogenase
MALESLTTREEVFAPVVALYRFKTEEEVIKTANDCDVGLGSFIVTENLARTWRVSRSLGMDEKAEGKVSTSTSLSRVSL